MRRLAAVFAHPDDDTFAVGGILAKEGDLEYTLIVATSGEAGLISDPALATSENSALRMPRSTSSDTRTVA